MGKEARTKAAVAPVVMLPREDVPVVAMMALMETIILDIGRSGSAVTGDRVIRQYREELRGYLMNYVKKYDGTFVGKVETGMEVKCERYLAKVQDALDGFFDELTPDDYALIDRVKGKESRERVSYTA